MTCRYNITENNRIDSLQALRALAFLGIFTSHAYLNSQLGAWGVSVFFILSGFLMSYNYMEKQVPCGFVKNIKFSWSKIKKLYPLHIVMLVIAIPFEIYRTGLELSAASLLTWAGRLVSNVFLVQAWIPSFTYFGAFNGVSWFLSAMAFLYFCFPFIVKLQKKYTRTVHAVIVMCSVFILMILIAFFTRNVTCLGTYPDNSYWLAYTCPVFRLGDFIIGCSLGWIYKKIQSENKTAVSINGAVAAENCGTACNDKHMGNYIIWSIAEIAAAGLIILSAVAYVSTDCFLGENWCRYTLLWIPTSLAIVWLFARKQGIISWLFTHRPFIWLGNISSDTFLIHSLVIIYINMILSRTVENSLRGLLGGTLTGDYIYIVIVAIICLGITLLAAVLWQKINRLIKRQRDKKTAL